MNKQTLWICHDCESATLGDYAICGECGSNQVTEGLPDIPQNRALWYKMVFKIESGEVQKETVDKYITENQEDYDEWRRMPTEI